ncbi:DNA translocase FtsK [Paenibacillus sp. GCM10012307]|uniref:DNA translocase FtsK n=1 Tax=Paenibacillus roseus TaxID=2798579 RepID=A0A934J8A3_9BACL|nr:DNA translocase FtsK [Paenibacillus roseus]MBJ6363438.1 DNA translocase FtsK [Paenibacillus roseus]
MFYQEVTDVAKRKRKKKSVGTSLKYEVYGILIITISVIALSGEATVGRALSKLFALILGKFYFVLPLIFICVGLAVMVKREWPSGWSRRKSGILLLIMALTLLSAINEIKLKLAGMPSADSASILSVLGSNIRSELDVMGTQDTPMFSKAISGGYLGAIQLSLLHMLFGLTVSQFILIVMFAISIMLITGKSYVEFIRIIVKRGRRLYVLLKQKWKAAMQARAKMLAQKVKQQKPKPAKAAPAPVIEGDDDEDYFEDGEPDYIEDLPSASADKREKKLLNLFSWGRNKGEGPPVNHEPNLPNQEIEQPLSPLEPVKGWSVSQAPYEVSDAAAAVDAWPPESGLSTDGEPHKVDSWPESLAEPAFDEELPNVLDSLADQHDMGVDSGVQDGLEEGTEETGRAAEAANQDGHTAATPPTEVIKPYVLPSLALLSKPKNRGPEGLSDANLRNVLTETLKSFNVEAKVLDVVRGPAVTRYEVQPGVGVKVSRIVALTDDIALALAAKDIRMEAPIPGKSAIGIEVPNMEVSVVTMREVMETTAFQHAPSKLSIAFGRDISGQPIVGNLAKMPHLLVAGATGSGKSVCINGIITSILYKAKPDEVRFLMIDPKMVELNVYNGIPHLLAPVVTDPRRASLALKKIVVEMEKRYELFSKSGTRNIEGYNTLMKDNPAAILPYIVVIVDELADLMMVAAGDVEDAITRLAQMARAAGIHLIIATQRPSVDVITGVIKANIPSRIAFGVSSQVDSRTILDMVGAEKLLGRGDMLFLPVGMSKPIRVQGAFLSDQEVEFIVNHVRGQAEAEYKEDLVPEIEETAEADNHDLDELFEQAVQIVLESKQASVSLLQRRMRVGYTRAARLVDQMEARNIVGPYEGSKPREVLTTLEQYQASKITS